MEKSPERRGAAVRVFVLKAVCHGDTESNESQEFTDEDDGTRSGGKD